MSRGLFLFCLACLGCLLGACGDDAPAGAPTSDILFSESFTDGSIGPWLLESDEQGQTIIADGRLVIALDALNLVQYTTLGDLNFSDFVLTFEASQTAGNPNSSYGLLWRMNSPNQFYRFEINSAGLYLVERRDGDGLIRELSAGWQPTSALLTGLNATNHVRLEAIGSQMKFYVNQQLIYEIADGTYLQGGIALDAGTFSEGGLQVTFDNLVIAQP